MWVEIMWKPEGLLRQTSSSLWGCELKYLTDECAYHLRKSSSLWGCELKFQIAQAIHWQSRHPPCEDVSWNSSSVMFSPAFNVILLVRMWVEICFLPFSNEALYRHPPCEDVSWNDEEYFEFGLFMVILLVRMWVEIVVKITENHPDTVILLVRMWVEINSLYRFTTVDIVILLVRMWGSITINHSDSMSGEILAFFYLIREDSNFYKWWVIRNISQGESIISDRDKMFRKDVQRFWGEYVSLSWPESCTKSHVRSI